MPAIEVSLLRSRRELRVNEVEGLEFVNKSFVTMT